MRPKVKHNQFGFYADNGFRLLLLDNRIEIDGEPNPAYRKRPVAPNWQKRKGLNPGTAHQRMKEGFNIGAAIPESILVIDVDARSGGLEDLRNIVSEAFAGQLIPESEEGFDPNASSGNIINLGKPSVDEAIACFRRETYTVKTSNKGHHFYFRCRPGLPLASKAAPGIDLLSTGRQVVTPGSVHPVTGEIYLSVGSEVIADLPVELEPFVSARPVTFTDEDLDDLREALDEPKQHSLWGMLSDPYQLERLLSVLPPAEYSDYNQWWFPLLCASHHAYAGNSEAKAVFANWSSWDPRYSDVALSVVDKKWETIDQLRRDSKNQIATIRTLLNAAEKECKKLIAAGRPFSTLLRCKYNNEACFYKDGSTLHAKEITLQDAIDNCKQLRQYVIEKELVNIEDHKECSKLLQCIDSLKPGWEKAKPDLKNRIVDIASSLDEKLWPEISAALSKVSTYSVTPEKIEKQIKSLKKEKLKQVDQEDYDLTQAELVEAVANRAMQTMVNHDGIDDSYLNSIISPPNGSVYKYLNGRWLEEPHSIIAGECYSKVIELADLKKKSTKPATDYAHKALATIIDKTASKSTDIYARPERPNCINLKNGTLWFSKGKPPEFKKHNREDLLTTQLPFDYDPSATCPDFDTMISQVFDHAGSEKAELTRHFWELVGYMIQPNKDIPKIIIWTGEGQNGKSRIAKTISRLVGDEAWLRADFQQFFASNQPHSLHAAEGKLVLMDDDLKVGVTLNDGALKKVSETTSILVNPKNRDAYSATLQLVPLVIANSYPRIEDVSNGMVRRLDVIEWKTNIRHLQDSPLPDKVDAEQIPGVLNRAVEGLARLRARGGFDLPKCCLEYRENFLKRSNTIYGFWSSVDRIQWPGETKQLSSLYEDYKAYVYEQSEGRPVSLGVFADNLRRCGVAIDGDLILDWIFLRGFKVNA